MENLPPLPPDVPTGSDATPAMVIAYAIKYARAAVAALEQRELEPVAWQWRRKGDPWTMELTFCRQVFATTDDSEVRPLYASPPTSADARNAERLRAQRDELLAVLQTIIGAHDVECLTKADVERARAVIAATKEKA